MQVSNRASVYGGFGFGGFNSALVILREVMVVIPAGAVSDTLTDFQVKIDLADLPDPFWTGIQHLGGNIRAYTFNGEELPIDVAVIDMTAKTGWLFFRADLKPTGNFFYLKTIDGALPYADGDNFGMAATWAGYAAVFSGNSVKNRASATGTPFGNYGTETYDLTTNPGWLTFNDTNSTQAVVAVAAWASYYGLCLRCTAKSSAVLTSNEVAAVSYGQGGWTTEYASYYHCDLMQSTSSYSVHGHSENYNTTSGVNRASDITSPANKFPSNVAVDVAWTIASKSHKLYVAGEQVSSATSLEFVMNSAHINAATVAIGGSTYHNYKRFKGKVTDVYLASSVQSLARFKAEHDNWNWEVAGKGFYSIIY